MRMMSQLFLTAVMLCVGVNSANRPALFPEPILVPDHQVHASVFDLTLPAEAINKWGRLISELEDCYLQEGATSHRVHWLYLRLAIEYFVDRGLIGVGHPDGVPVPCSDYQYIRLKDYVAITDRKTFVNIVRYNDDYAHVVVPDSQGRSLARQLVALFLRALINIAVTLTKAVPNPKYSLI